MRYIGIKLLFLGDKRTTNYSYYDHQKKKKGGFIIRTPSKSAVFLISWFKKRKGSFY